MKKRIAIASREWGQFLQAVQGLQFNASPQEWKNLFHFLGVHWHGSEVFPPTSLELAAKTILASSTLPGWTVTIGLNLLAGLPEVRFRSPDRGYFALRPSLQFAAAYMMELPKESLSEPFQRFWETING